MLVLLWVGDFVSVCGFWFCLCVSELVLAAILRPFGVILRFSFVLSGLSFVMSSCVGVFLMFDFVILLTVVYGCLETSCVSCDLRILCILVVRVLWLYFVVCLCFVGLVYLVACACGLCLGWNLFV